MNSPTSQAVLSIAERSVVAYGQTTEGVLGALRQMPLEDFAELMIGLPDPRYPGLSSVLPSMASPEIQLAYTGSHGKVLLRESLAFVRQLLALWASFGEGSLERARVLDFGRFRNSCGLMWALGRGRGRRGGRGWRCGSAPCCGTRRPSP
jgi:hypothetical protein